MTKLEKVSRRTDLAPYQQEVLIQANNVKKYFPIKGGILKRTIGHLKAVDGVSLQIHKGETLGIVGESGSGKTTFGRVLLRLLKPTDGQIVFNGVDITNLSNSRLQPLRKDMQIIFQDPFASLNPRMSIEELIEEPLIIQKLLPKNERKQQVVEMLEKVGLRSSDRMKYPHEFSGGQRQRISIARALILNPMFVICDEPVSALDVSIQSQVLNLMKDLQDDLGLTFLFISHDLSVIKHISDRVAVMYLGRIVEITTKRKIYETPLHPYTQALISAIPVIDEDERTREKIILKGDLPESSRSPIRMSVSNALSACP